MPATVAMTLTSATSARTLISGVGWRRMMLSRDVGITFHLALGEGHRLFVLGDPLDVPHALEYVLVGDESRRLGPVEGDDDDIGDVDVDVVVELGQRIGIEPRLAD